MVNQIFTRVAITFFLFFAGIIQSKAFTPLNTHPEVQLGLSGVSSYGSPMFANAMYMETRGWKVVGTNAAPASDQLDELGYPKYLTSGTRLYVNPGQNSGASQPAYGGRICISWEGDADIRCAGSYLTSNTPATGMAVNGRRFYNNGTTPNGVYLVIYDINPANPPKNIRIWLNDLRDPSKSLAPEEQGGVQYYMHPTFEERFAVEAFSIFRFMNWTTTTDCSIVNWSDRRKPNHCFQKGIVNNVDLVGVCYEDIITMCNKLGKDMWINIPAKANEQFVKNLAKLIDGQDPDNTGFQGLNKNLRCFVEYSNEMGWAFWQTYCTEQGNLQSPVQTGRKWAAYQKARVASWFRSVVGSTNEQYKIVQALQSSNPTDSEIELGITCTTYGPTLTPSGAPDNIAVTSYVSNKMEEYIFNDLNFTDPTIRDKELSKYFLEYEKRQLQASASVSGVDYTSGISDVAISMSKKYGKPIVVYEGGSGMGLTGNKYVVDCKVVPSSTAGATSKIFYNYIETCGAGNQAKYMDFIIATHTHPLMYDMFNVAFSLSKKAGAKTLSQFGDIGDTSANLVQYGWWYCMRDLKQDPNQAYRYKFWLDWYNEQKDIREINDSVGIAPHFITKSLLKSAKVGETCQNEISFTKGDGQNTVKLISRKEHLPQSLTFSVSDSKITISGTPVAGEEGDYYFLYRILDADKDPAYGVYTFKVLPAPLDTVFAYDDFGTIEGAVYQKNTGTGFTGGWMMSNSTASDIFVKTTTPLTYSGLKTSGGGYIDGGTNNRVCARNLDVSKFDYLINSSNNTLIRQPNSSLWFSALVRRTETVTNRDVFRFLQGSLYSDKYQSQIAIQINTSGYFQLDCINPALTQFTSNATSVYCNPNQTYLVVMELNFNSDKDSVKLYINPAIDHKNPVALIPDARFGTELGQFYPLTKYAYVGKNVLSVSADDIRFGDSFKAVTPTDPNSAVSQNEINPLTIFASEKLLHINGATDSFDMNLYDATGMLLMKKHINQQSATIPLNFKGLIIVNCSNKSLFVSKKINVY